MGKIIIHADDSFEAVAAAKPKDLKGHQERVKELKRDVSIATKIEAQQKKLETLKERLAKLKVGAKTEAVKARIVDTREKIASLREIIKGLKGTLSTPLNAKLERAKEQLTKAQQAKADHSSKHLPRNQKVSRDGDAAKVRRSEKKLGAYSPSELEARITKLEARIAKGKGGTKISRDSYKAAVGELATLKSEQARNTKTHGGAGRPFLRRNIRKLANQIATTKRQISDAKTQRERKALEASLAKLETSLKAAQTSLRASKV